MSVDRSSAGMYKFRHKTKQRINTIIVPLVLIMQIVISVILLSGCGYSGTAYKKITQDEAMQIMQEQSDYLIVDVRRPDEYAEGHIANAINVPNESITDEMPDKLPDKEQIILIYCRSGNRSKEASQKLADMGYTNIYEFGGIDKWNGEIVTEDNVNDSEETPVSSDDRVPVEFDENGNPSGEYAQYLWEQQQMEEAKNAIAEEAMREYYEEQEKPDQNGFPF